MISVTQLSFERYFQPVFQPIDFSLQAGNLLMVTGANGSGKTTLIRLLAGVLSPSSGKIIMQASSLAHVGHQLALKDDLSVMENLRFACDFYGSDGTPLNQVILRLGLKAQADQLARTLSAGQRKRCAMGRLLINPAQLWLMDEPYSNLDDEGQQLIDSMVQAHTGKGGACIMATHGAHRPAGVPVRELKLLSGCLEAAAT